MSPARRRGHACPAQTTLASSAPSPGGRPPYPPLSRGAGPMVKTAIISDPPRETKSCGCGSKLRDVAQFHCLTFLTDYGLEDAFVAVCHAVASQVAPDVQITDITHLIPLGDIRRGAMVLAQAVPYFPPAVHVAVVDPGVGTARRGVAVEAGGSLFVGPDNGLLSVALAAGLPLEQAGEPAEVNSLVTLPRPECRITSGGALVEVVTVDGFGNVQLSLPGADAPRAGLTPGKTVTLTWAGREITAPFVTTFGEVAPGEPLCYRDSGDWVALAVANGNAARRYDLRPGTRMTLIVT